MNSERLQLKGVLSELKMKKADLASRITARVGAMKKLLATSSISPIEEICLAEVETNAVESHALQKEYFGVLANIAKIEKELE